MVYYPYPQALFLLLLLLKLTFHLHKDPSNSQWIIITLWSKCRPGLFLTTATAAATAVGPPPFSSTQQNLRVLAHPAATTNQL